MITEEVLQQWSGIGAEVLSQKTYASLQSAFSHINSPIAKMDYEIYLQGSYKNSTYIRGNSDVDVDIQIKSVFLSDIDKLSENQKEYYRKTFSNTSYTWVNFRDDVLKALIHYYGSQRIHEGDRSIKLDGNDNYLPADIIVAITYRKYSFFYSMENSLYVEGIAFWTQKDKTLIVNYPKIHFANGVEKNSANRTNFMYKPIIRMFKNVLVKMIDTGIIGSGVASSYFIECLLYNVPDLYFTKPLRKSLFAITGWILDQGVEGISQFVCQNGITKLFGTDSTQWDIGNLITFIKGLSSLDWG